MARIDLSAQLADIRARVAAETSSDAEAAVPMVAQLEKKTTLIREEQYVELTSLARFLMKRRRVRGERITENTLIRVAIDLLFAHRHHLAGSTEAELRSSVTSELRNSATSELQHVRAGEAPNYTNATGPKLVSPDLLKRSEGEPSKPDSPARRQSRTSSPSSGTAPVNVDARRGGIGGVR